MDVATRARLQRSRLGFIPRELHLPADMPPRVVAARHEAAGKLSRNHDAIVNECINGGGLKRGYSNPYGPTADSINGKQGACVGGGVLGLGPTRHGHK